MAYIHDSIVIAGEIAPESERCPYWMVTAAIRAEARMFLRDRAALAFWCDVLGLPETVMHRCVTAALADRQVQQPRRESPQLAFDFINV